MKKRMYLIQCMFLLIMGAILLILTFTLEEKSRWLDIAKIFYFVFVFLFQLGWFIINKNKKIENVNDEEIKKLLQEGRKKEAIEKIMKDSNCGLLKGILYVGNLEAHKKV